MRRKSIAEIAATALHRWLFHSRYYFFAKIVFRLYIRTVDLVYLAGAGKISVLGQNIRGDGFLLIAVDNIQDQFSSLVGGRYIQIRHFMLLRGRFAQSQRKFLRIITLAVDKDIQ